MTMDRQTIADEITVVKQRMARQAPGQLLAAFAQEQAGLESAGIPAGAAAPGTPMPDGSLLDVHGLPATIERARAGRPAVIVFYRGGWCPFCNVALRAYQREVLPVLDSWGMVLIALSPQAPDGSLSTQEAKELTFTVLSDPGNQVAAQLGILTTPTDGARASRAALGLDVAAANADGTDALPMPTVIITDGAGIIRWIDIHPDYATRTESAAIIAALSTITI
jgi:peroxiredoxin